MKYFQFLIIAITRKTAKLKEGWKGLVEQLTDKGISPNLLQKMFEKLSKKFTAMNTDNILENVILTFSGN